MRTYKSKRSKHFQSQKYPGRSKAQITELSAKFEVCFLVLTICVGAYMESLVVKQETQVKGADQGTFCKVWIFSLSCFEHWCRYRITPPPMMMCLRFVAGSTYHHRDDDEDLVKNLKISGIFV